MKSQKGFNLIELMVVVVIIGILARISLPTYSNYVMRGKIPEATSWLSSLRVSMEQSYQDNRTYQSSPANGTACATSVVMPTAPQVQYFTFTCSASTSATYTLTATGVGSMAGFTYTIDNNNTKQTTAAPSGWAAATMPTTCWITKQGGTC